MKLNFLARIYLAITDFRVYPYIVQKEKFITAFAYFLSFIMLLSLVLSTNFVAKAFNWTNELLQNYNEKIPLFSIEAGVLDAQENINVEIDGVRIYINDEQTKDDIELSKFDDQLYDFSIIALKDVMLIGKEGENYVYLPISYEGVSTTGLEIYDVILQTTNSISARAEFAFITFGITFIIYFITKFINVLGITLILSVMGLIFRLAYKFVDYLKVACYVITLPVIIEIIALMITGGRPEYVDITYYLLLYIYMYYAIRALKLDNIIMVTQEKMIKIQKDIEAKEKANKENEDQENNQEDNQEDNQDDNKE